MGTALPILGMGLGSAGWQEGAGPLPQHSLSTQMGEQCLDSGLGVYRVCALWESSHLHRFQEQQQGHGGPAAVWGCGQLLLPALALLPAEGSAQES